MTMNNNHDFLKLMDSDSNSDSIELLDLPPPKGKKARRNKGKSSSNGSPPCSICVVLNVIVLIVLITAVAILGAFTYNFTHQIKDLNDKIKSIEQVHQKSQVALAQLQETKMDKNLTFQSILNSCQKDLQEARSNYTRISAKIKDLEGKVGKSTKSDESYQDLKAEIGKLGTSAMTDKAGYTAKFTDLETRVKALETTVANTPKHTTNGEQGGREDTEIPHYVYDLNTKYKTLQNLTAQLQSNLTHMSTLITADTVKPNTAKPLNMTELQTQIASQLVPVISNLTKTGQMNAVSLDLLDRFANLSSQVASLNKKITKSKVKSLVNTTKDLKKQLKFVVTDVQTLKQTVSTIQQDIATMNTTLTTQFTALSSHVTKSPILASTAPPSNQNTEEHVPTQSDQVNPKDMENLLQPDNNP